MSAISFLKGATNTRLLNKSIRYAQHTASRRLSAPGPFVNKARSGMTVSAAAAPEASNNQQHDAVIAEVQRTDSNTPIEITALPCTSREAQQSHLHDQGPQLQQHATKTVYLIRHGEGWHNIGYDHNLDPHLTPRGWAQTGALQQHLAALQQQFNIELVVVSPLRRTLETAAGVFGAAAPPAALQAARAAGAISAAAAADDGHSTWVWMRPQLPKASEVTRRDVIYLPAAGFAAAAAASACNGVQGSSGSDGNSNEHVQQQQEHQPLRIMAHEGCRERIGPNVCDKFRDMPLQITDFPGVDFSLMQHSTDVAWEQLHEAQCKDGGCYFTGEEESATEQRALEFYRWLLSRPESRIAVVSHCGFLVHGMRALGKSMLKYWSDNMLQQCCTVASLQSAGIARDNTAASAVNIQAKQAEQLRLTASEIAGRMSVDWMNCEMRSIELGWVPERVMQASTAGNGINAEDRWLWAAPGNAVEWFPGGSAGI